MSNRTSEQNVKNILGNLNDFVVQNAESSGGFYIVRHPRHTKGAIYEWDPSQSPHWANGKKSEQAHSKIRVNDKGDTENTEANE